MPLLRCNLGIGPSDQSSRVTACLLSLRIEDTQLATPPFGKRIKRGIWYYSPSLELRIWIHQFQKDKTQDHADIASKDAQCPVSFPEDSYCSKKVFREIWNSNYSPNGYFVPIKNEFEIENVQFWGNYMQQNNFGALLLCNFGIGPFGKILRITVCTLLLKKRPTNFKGSYHPKL